jgi:hypothetical protein
MNQNHILKNFTAKWRFVIENYLQSCLHSIFSTYSVVVLA